jgi:glycosidase
MAGRAVSPKRDRRSRFVQPPSPPWTKDLIIYELEIKGFTSLGGPETGTFRTLRERLGYLEELGVTAILTGVPWLSDAHHYYFNIWMHYAVLEPDKFDPSLGSEEDFTRLVNEAHQRGIRILLDVRTAGVLSASPLLKEHPEWFRGVSWSLPDFDWYGGHQDLDDWWVQIWKDYVRKHKVDGFRLDVNIFRPDLWERVRKYAADIGHPIVIFEEGNAVLPGVTDFIQKEYEMPIPLLLNDVPGFYDLKYGTGGNYEVLVVYADGSRAEGNTNGEGTLRIRLDGLRGDHVARRKGYPITGDGSDTVPDGVPDVQLTVENVSNQPIGNITVRNALSRSTNGEWQSAPYHFVMSNTVHPLNYERSPSGLKLFVSTLQNGFPSIKLSSQDDGWGMSADESAYVAKGSRAMFGYSILFAPAIPFFFSGEEFDATFRPLPSESPDILSGADPGKGRLLYGCWLNWKELDQPEHRAMFEDVKKMIAVRKRESEILDVKPEIFRPRLMAVPFEADKKVPRPYIRWSSKGTIVVAANPNTEEDAILKLRIPLDPTGLAGRGPFKVSDLWPGEPPMACAETDLENFTCAAPRDKRAGGGLRVLKIEPASQCNAAASRQREPS